MAEPWTTFRNLCNYYADCVRYSERSQEYLFPNQLNRTFMIPRLPVGWHLKDEEFVVDTSKDEVYARTYMLDASDEEDLFIGYPLNSFVSPAGNECLCPVLTFPVTASVRGPGFTNGMKLKIDRTGISANQTWIEYHIPRDDQISFRRACERTEDEAGCLDVEMVLGYIGALFKPATLDPDRMQFSVRFSEAKRNLLNTAVLFRGAETKYTRNLISELRRISKEPDAVLDRTALAYVFRDPPLPHEEPSERRVPVSFTDRKMQAAQFDAVAAALNEPVTKVTGPPGTGKSFMAVNLIANEVLAGGSVLFTSKNHKAIHAICDKAPDAISNKDFPLVAFCTVPGNPTNADWRKSQDDVDMRLDKFEALKRNGAAGVANGEIWNTASDLLEVCQCKYRDAEVHIKRRHRQQDIISRYERLLTDLDAALGAVPELKRDSEEFIKLLEEREQLIALWRSPTFLERVASFFRIGARGKPAKLDLKALLSDTAPRVANAIASRDTATKEIRRLLKLLTYRRHLKELERAECEAIRTESSDVCHETLMTEVEDALAGAEESVQKAYVERLLARSAGIEDPDSLVARCIDAVAGIEKRDVLDFMTAVDDGKRYDAPVNRFREFLDVFPAWAGTMLSLRRAAPCLPGVFTLAIIDEASQCDIPPVIPVLFRAQRLTVAGDPSQFPPVITLKESLDRALRRKYGLGGPEFRKYAYRGNSLFSVVPGRCRLLNEHFRCADGIAQYFNEEFYGNELLLCNEMGRTDESAVAGLKPGMMWQDAPGGDAAEIEAAIEFLRGLKQMDFQGTIGVISPLRDLANMLKTRIADNSGEVPAQLDVEEHINTANGFQGAECDVILFLLGLNDDRTHGQEWYITSPENRYIYNVSVSRAKRLFVAFGDRRRALQSEISHIRKLIPEERPPRKVKVGPGEERLKAALERAGIHVHAQYPVLNRFLDLAIVEKKIDIEVDGQAYHRDRNGCRKADDIHRDRQLHAAGWKVLRFWHHEVIENIAGCVEKVKRAMEENHTRSSVASAMPDGDKTGGKGR